jgi:hypothetical protein
MIARKACIYVYLAVGASLLSAQSITYLATNPEGHSFEIVARGNQTGDTATTFGYLSHVDGMDDAALFSTSGVPAGTKSEVNARMTVVTTLTFTDRFVNANLVIGVQDEAMTIYFSEFPTARDFTQPDTFSQGTVVATFHNRAQTILNVQTPISEQGPGRAVVQATTEANQESSTVFTLDGNRFAFGQIGSTYRIVSAGEGTLASVSPLAATFVFGSYAELPNRRRTVLRF